jgi:hypothetical protein
MDRLRFLAQKSEWPPIRSPGAWGYLLSMERLLEQMLRDGIDQVLVLDDDIGLLRATSAIFPAAVRELPNDWRILQLGTMQFDWKDTAIIPSISIAPMDLILRRTLSAWDRDKYVSGQIWQWTQICQ